MLQGCKCSLKGEPKLEKLNHLGNHTIIVYIQVITKKWFAPLKRNNLHPKYIAHILVLYYDSDKINTQLNTQLICRVNARHS